MLLVRERRWADASRWAARHGHFFVFLLNDLLIVTANDLKLSYGVLKEQGGDRLAFFLDNDIAFTEKEMTPKHVASTWKSKIREEGQL